MFFETTYQAGTGKNYKEYIMNRDGFTLLAMGFTGADAMQWKIKYIQAFNSMEKQLAAPVHQLSPEIQAIFKLDTRTVKLETQLNDLQDNMPLFNVECDELQALVRKVGMRCLGGKESLAYKDRSLRGKVYADIQSILKREFGVERYKAIKRNQIKIASEIIGNYQLPFVLKAEISGVNL
jgi:hypothetical protein